MNNSEKYPDIVDRLMKLIKANFGGFFKQYYEGDPIEIPKANYPCVIIEKVGSNVSLGATGQDVLVSQYNIRFLLDKSDDFNASDTKDLTEKKLRELVEARDPQTGLYLENSLLYVLRTNITIGQVNVATDVDIRYDLQPRPNQVVTSEALVSIVTNEKVLLPRRN